MVNGAQFARQLGIIYAAVSVQRPFAFPFPVRTQVPSPRRVLPARRSPTDGLKLGGPRPLLCMRASHGFLRQCASNFGRGKNLG